MSYAAVDVPAVAAKIPLDEELFPDGGPPNVGFLRKHFQHEGKLSEAQTMRILEEGTALLRSEPTCLVTDAPITSTPNRVYCANLQSAATFTGSTLTC